MFARLNSIVLGLSLVVAPAALAEEKPAVTGKVLYEGKPPAARTVNPAVDNHCAKEHEKEPIKDERFVVDKDGGLKNIFVVVSEGLPKDKKYEAPSTPAVLDQKGCTYVPHVIGVQTGQALKVINSDDTNHNVHGLPSKNKEFNLAQPRKGKTDEIKLTQPEVFQIKCDVHQWMGAWAHVVEHPFFAVTNEKGEYAINGLPAGEYELAFYHEGKQFHTEKVKVEDGKSAKASDVKFEPPTRGTRRPAPRTRRPAPSR